MGWLAAIGSLLSLLGIILKEVFSDARKARVRRKETIAKDNELKRAITSRNAKKLSETARKIRRRADRARARG